MTRAIFIFLTVFIFIFTAVPGFTADSALDIDGNGTVDFLTDGILIQRYLIGLTGNDLIRGAIGTNAARTTASDIETYLSNLERCGSSTPTNPTSETFTNSVGMTFVEIPAGTFMMGSPADEPGRWDDENQHQVTLTQAFYIQTTEVTQGQWRAVVGTNPSYFTNCGDNCPVEQVSWNDIQSFIGFMNQRGEGTYRLPTEAEWEYAARAGSTTALYTGDIQILGWNNAPALDPIAWYGGNSCVTYSGAYDCSSWSERQYPCSTGCGSHPVGQKQANAWGLYDMHGNVWEWVSDWYGTYPTGDSVNPTGPSTGSGRVVRGGSWIDTAAPCRSAVRSWDLTDGRGIILGFRLALSPVQR